MLPVFKEYIQFLKDVTNNDNQLDDLAEGYYWVDNQIIKSFDKKGNTQKFLRINIDKNLNVTIKPYKGKYDKDIESWYDTSIRLQDGIIRLELESLRILSEYKNANRIIIDTNSTGKDSMVKTYLAKLAGLKFETYFNVTTCDVADSNIMAKNNKYISIRPNGKSKGFYKWVKKENIIPSRLNRGCCTLFKEEPTIRNFDAKEK